MKKRKGPAAFVLLALAADIGYVLLKSTKTILKTDKNPNENNKRN